MRLGKIIFSLVLILLAGASFYFFYYLPVSVDRKMNVVLDHQAYEITPQARALHETLRLADLHDDMLLWMRDPTKRHDRGHTDFPRLRSGGVALQVFSAVTKAPSHLNYEANSGDTDNITPLAIAQRWPIKSWGSIYERAAYQAQRLQRYEQRSNGQLVIARTRQDLIKALQQRERDPNILVGILAIEGAHPLEGKIENIQNLYNEGYRVMGLQHFFDNELGGSLHGLSKAGLTDFGRAAIAKMQEMDIIVDVAHSSPAVVRDVLAQSTKPIIVSHTGIFSKCETVRNISDDLMAEITKRGGLLGIGYWEEVTCNASPEGIAAVIIYAADKFGVDHIALGSDFDGTVTTQLDASELAALTNALLAQGMPVEDIRKVMGENAIRFFSANLPQ
ncbi:MAG: dipeptidase [bacterium]